MVVIRLSKVGKSKKKYHYRIVVCDSRIATDSRCIEELGYYNPTKHPTLLKIDTERVDYWLKVGAKSSSTVERLIKKYRKEAK